MHFPAWLGLAFSRKILRKTPNRVCGDLYANVKAETLFKTMLLQIATLVSLQMQSSEHLPLPLVIIFCVNCLVTMCI